MTDHKPLTTIFGANRGVPALAAARLQRWALQLSAYDYTIEFRSTAKHANADGLFHLGGRMVCAVGLEVTQQHIVGLDARA